MYSVSKKNQEEVINDRLYEIIISDLQRSITVNQFTKEYYFDNFFLGDVIDLKAHLFYYLRVVYGIEEYLLRQSFIEDNFLKMIR